MPIGVGYCPLADGHFHICKEEKMRFEDWLERNNKCKTYAHFDKRVAVSDVLDKIMNAEWIEKHGFYPFIHFTHEITKYSSNDGKKNKKREICYSSHIDRCIFQYYSYLLNEKYNLRVEKDGLNLVAVAYRNNLGLNNIHFAKIAFDYIKLFGTCYIMIGDYTNFFDNLNHQYLKRRLCDLLEVDVLPSDYYAVFKNVTKYSFWELTDLLKINNLSEAKSEIKKLNSKDTVITLEQLKNLKKRYLKKNKDQRGIPQGSAISAVLANIYMLDADKKINSYVEDNNGLYMRYSDDFIIILPCSEISFKSHYNWIKNAISLIPDVELSPEKTKIFKYEDRVVSSCNNTFEPQIMNGSNMINFLGFSFDGQEVIIRDKTVSKYYYRMYHKAKTIRDNSFISPKGNHISCRNLYKLYSKKGAHCEKGNFLTYVERANDIFDKKEPIERSTKNHMQKIRKALNK